MTGFKSIKQTGPFIIVSGPSGVGKTLFITKSLSQFPRLANSISWTTRAPRKGEKQGDFYYFRTKTQFQEKIKQGGFLEWAKVHHQFYGTTQAEVKRLWGLKKAIIKDIDVKGCALIKKVFPKSVSIFIYPPSLEELRERILTRGTEDKKELKKRLFIATQEMAMARHYDHKIVNDSFKEAWEDFKKILKKSLASPKNLY